ncbi:30S ribosomal protein S6 [Candidatus Kaiserbacteria bacterium]|nr:30S ribosomal protein S6 [Candidatus Kaiserbacteria bacterium]
MSETKMPVAEVASEAVLDEQTAYEIAFHVLPTVAEGEVSRVFDSIKEQITNNGGEIISSEAPERFELAYEIIKQIDSKNRKFKSAYFGWIRFKLTSSVLEHLVESVETNPELLRHLIIKLSKTEEANPFYFHQALASEKATKVDKEEDVADEETDEVDEAGDEETDSEAVDGDKDEEAKEEDK